MQAVQRQPLDRMTINEELIAFRSQFPDCSVMIFADLSTGLVLAASTAVKTTQEKLDALCVEGCDLLMGQQARAVSAGFSTVGQSGIDVAVCADLAGVKCFVRAPLPAHEMFCFVLGGNTAVEALLSDARGLLAHLVAEG